MKLKSLIHNLRNRLQYGPDAPRSRQLLWLPPGEINFVSTLPCGWPGGVGIVKDGDWDSAVRKFNMHPVICKHFVDGIPWADMELTDIEIVRYQYYETIWQHIKTHGRMQTSPEYLTGWSRWFGGYKKEIRVHIGRDGNFIMHDNGNHRLTLNRLGGARVMPVTVGYVHLRALQSGTFAAVVAKYGRAVGV